MWVRNQDTSLWTPNVDTLSTSNFDLLKQDLKSLRFYQKVLSGALFSQMHDINNIYEVLTKQMPKTYAYNNSFSPYVKPHLGFIENPEYINSTSSQFDFLNKHLLEYGQTLKNLFTPSRLINDQIKNLNYVDVATTERLENITLQNLDLIIDGIKLKNGHRVLVKDQTTLVVLAENVDPYDYFDTKFIVSDQIANDIYYLVYNSENGIYVYQNGFLTRSEDLEQYENLINTSYCVKLGTQTGKQFRLQRLKDSHFPRYQDGEGLYFSENKNWVLRNRMDYNNIYELILNDTLKHGTQSARIDQIVYQIPERTITVGEFGTIINHQEDYSNFIDNKYKTTLRAISQNDNHYWVCGDDGTLLRVSKIDFTITKVTLEEKLIIKDKEGFDQEKKFKVDTTLNSVSFSNNLRGVVVGKFNQIWVTEDSGDSWARINVPDFDGFNFNSVIYLTIDTFYVGGDNGVFIEFNFGDGNWTAYRRRISQFRTPKDEYLLVDDIKDLDYFVDNSGFFTGTASFIAIAAENGYLFVYDLDGRINQLRDVDYDFYYIGGSATSSNNCGICEVVPDWIDNQFGDIQSVSYQESNSKLLFSTFDSVYQVSPFIGAYSSTSSNILAVECTNYFTQSGVNSIYSYESETIITGINSLWKSITETYVVNSNNPDVYAILDSTSVALEDALNASTTLDLWFQKFCLSNPNYTGTLYVLPSFAQKPGSAYVAEPPERWLDLPRQIISTASNGDGNFYCLTAGGTTLPASFLPYRMSYTQSLTLERENGNMTPLGQLRWSFLGDPQSGSVRTFTTWSRPTDMILLAFFDESNDPAKPGYHAASTKLWATYSNHTTYETDYREFTKWISPLTGDSSTKMNSFVGILYPIIKGAGAQSNVDVLNGAGASLVLQAISGLYGSTLSVAEIEAIPGLSTDTTTDYPGEPYNTGGTSSLIVDNDTSGWTDGWNLINAQALTFYNPYIGLTGPDNQPGLVQHGWKVVADKRKLDPITKDQIDVFEVIEFSNSLNTLLGFGSASTSGINVYHESFFTDLKPRLLFMDYDAGSKLYWFDDFGQYRLPERIYVPVSYLVDSTATTQSFIDFKENSNTLFDGNTGLTTSYLETNWITYWKDRMKTFEYHTHLDDAYKVEPSFRFESSNSLSGIFTYTASDITTSVGDINNLMPVKSESRFRDSGQSIILTGPSHNLYFYKFLGIWAITIASTEEPPKKGDVIEIECSIFKSKFIINKVLSYTDGVTTHYQYFYTDFNENILNNLSGFTGEMKVKNLNKYATTKGGIKTFTSTYGNDYTQGSYKNIQGTNRSSFDIEVNSLGEISSIVLNQPGFGFVVSDVFTISAGEDFGGTVDITIVVDSLNFTSEFLTNFKSHYINYAYEIEETSTDFPLPTNNPIGLTQSFQITAKYSQYSAYYNLQTNVEILTIQNYLLELDMRYQTSFLNFGYSPTYNLLSYLNFVDNKKYLPSREFLSMPCYIDIPGPDSGVADTSVINDNIVYMDFVLGDYSGVIETNKIYFGLNLKHLYDSLYKWTFVDLVLKVGAYPPPVGAQEFTTERLLIIDKFKEGDYYVVVFHDKFNGNNNVSSVSILSRRSLQQISDDLQYINNIQRPKWKEISIEESFSYTNYESDIGYKISTDSYTKILLSDSEIIKDLSAIIYTDYKYELAVQIIKLQQEFNLVPTSVSISANSKYRLSTPQKHNLRTGEGVVVQCTATESNWPQILGYRTVRVLDENNFEIDVNWGGFMPLDPLNIYFVKKDPFLNFQPCDLFDLGVGDKLVKQSIQILPENYDLEDRQYFLQNVDTQKYRYRLIDGLDLVKLSNEYYWVLDAEVSDAIIGLDSSNNLVWYTGNWEGGRWFGGTWISGNWKSGDWYDGVWTSKSITDKKLSVKYDETVTDNINSKWFTGRWFGGTWQNGTWYGGRWYGGTWNDGRWFDGTWNDGTWNDGRFTGGIWIRGNWNNGIFNTDSKRSFWLDGSWFGGDFENGIWYNGNFNSKSVNKKSRFGTKAFLTRKAIWYAGKFNQGEFHSFLNLDRQNVPIASVSHKNSVWYTGKFSGYFYGGNVFNMSFDYGIWSSGIVHDISIIRVNTNNNSFTLNGIYRFNINDKVTIMDNLTSSTYSVFGTTENPLTYQILDTTIYEEVEQTEIIVDKVLSNIYGSTVDTGIIDTKLKVVSKFKNVTWKNGVWVNGLFEDGNFMNGLWYDGNFSGNWG